MHDPFSGAMSHYNPNDCEHPFHAGDLSPLFGNHGYVFTAFLIDRFSLKKMSSEELQAFLMRYP